MPCGGFAGLVAYAIDAPAAPAAAATGGVRAAQPTYLVVRATALAEGTSPHFAIVLDLPVNEYTRAAIERGLGRRAARHHDRVRGGASPQHADLARAPCSWRPPTEREPVQPPFFVFTEFADWATGTPGRRRCRFGMNIGQIYDRLRPTHSARQPSARRCSC